MGGIPNDEGSRRATQFMPAQAKALRKPYSAPSFKVHDANTAKATLEIEAVSGDVGASAMLTSISNSKAKLRSETTDSSLHRLEKPFR